MDVADPLRRLELPAKVFVGPTLILGPVVFAGGLLRAAGDANAEWTEVPARVLARESTEIRHTVGRNGTARKPGVRLTFEYDAQDGTRTWTTVAHANTPLGRTPVGGSATLYYDRDEPDDVRLAPGTAAGGLFAAYVGAVFTALGVACAAFLRSRRRTRPAPDPRTHPPGPAAR